MFATIVNGATMFATIWDAIWTVGPCESAPRRTTARATSSPSGSVRQETGNTAEERKFLEKYFERCCFLFPVGRFLFFDCDYFVLDALVRCHVEKKIVSRWGARKTFSVENNVVCRWEARKMSSGVYRIVHE